MNARLTYIPILLLSMIGATLLLPGCSKSEVTDPQGAIVTALVGSVRATFPDGRVVVLTSKSLYKKDAILSPGSSIVTGRNSRTELMYTSGVRLRLGPDSALKIGDARILSKNGYTRIRLHLSRGRLFARSDPLDPGSSLMIKTVTAIASVRGTEFMVKANGGKSEVLVQKGSVLVGDAELKKVERVDADKKATVKGLGDVSVEPLSDADRDDLRDLGSEIAGITESGRKQIQNIINTFEDQKALIKKAYEEQRDRDKDLVKNQKEKDKKIVGDQAKKDRELLQNQIRRDREIMDKVRGDTTREKNKVLDKTSKSKTRVIEKSRKNFSKILEKNKNKKLDETRKQLERLKNP